MQTSLTSAPFRRRLVLIACWIVVAIFVLWLASRIPRTLTVFLVAGFIAFGVNPIVGWLTRRMPRAAAIAIVYVGLLGAVVVLTLLVVPALLAQVQILSANAPSYIVTIQSWIDAAHALMMQRMPRGFTLPDYDIKGLLASKFELAFSVSVASLYEIFTGTITAAFIGISALVLSAFFLLRGEHVIDWVYDLLPSHRRAAARELAGELANVFGAYVSGQVALCAITGALIFAFTTFFGFKFGLLLGILSGIAYAVPYVGQVFAHLVAIVLAAPQGTAMIVEVNAVVFAIGRISDNLLVPRIMSRSVGVSPIVVMFAVFAGGELFGLAGLLLGIPAAALAKVAWQYYRRGRIEPDAGVSDASLPVPSVPVPTPQEA